MTITTQTCSTTARYQLRIDNDIADNVHRVLQIALHLHQHVLAGTAQQNGAGLGVDALGNESEIPVNKKLLQLAKCLIQSCFQTQSTYSSPSFLISKRPAPVPMSDSLISSVRLMMVAPHARAIRLLSDFRTRRMAVMLAWTR